MDDQKREITVAVGNRIRYFRRLQSISQEELALRANLNPAYFGQVERGLKCPTVDTLYKIAKAMNISPAELLRTESLPDYSTDHTRRMNELLAQVPKDKLEPLFRVIEDLAKLF